MTRQKSERELEQIQKNLEYSNKNLKVFIADIFSPEETDKNELEAKMLETENLVNTYGGIVILEHIQKKSKPDYNTYIGTGKLDEIIAEMEFKGANLLILGNILKSSQIYKINERLKKIGAKAWDRIDLILKIFERHAKTKEARLQIELASIKHMGPRIFDMGMELGKQGGKGKGETNTEIMKRHLQKREMIIKKDLENFAKNRAEHRKTRKRKGLNTIGIVGYTNAGKSCLTNALTKKGVLEEDKLFATLGTSIGKMWIAGKISAEQENLGEFQRGKEFLVNDTIGFIRDLPPELIEAFNSTLEDSIESDLLLHVVDSSDEKLDEKIKVVDDILDKIGAHQKKIYVFNKIDKLKNEKDLKILRKKYSHLKSIFISAYKKQNLEDLKNEIMKLY